MLDEIEEQMLGEESQEELGRTSSHVVSRLCLMYPGFLVILAFMQLNFGFRCWPRG